jgi:hypothetical protein
LMPFFHAQTQVLFHIIEEFSPKVRMSPHREPVLPNSYRQRIWI